MPALSTFHRNMQVYACMVQAFMHNAGMAKGIRYAERSNRLSADGAFWGIRGQHPREARPGLSPDVRSSGQVPPWSAGRRACPLPTLPRKRGRKKRTARCRALARHGHGWMRLSALHPFFFAYDLCPKTARPPSDQVQGQAFRDHAVGGAHDSGADRAAGTHLLIHVSPPGRRSRSLSRPAFR